MKTHTKLLPRRFDETSEAMNDSDSLPSAASPLKGRTAQRRSRKIIRTGVLALEEAKERASEEGGDRSSDISGEKEDDVISGDDVHPAQSSDSIKENAISTIRKRRKRQKASGHMAQPFANKRGEFDIFAVCSRGVTKRSRAHGTYQSKIRPAENLLSVPGEKPGSIIGITKETTSQCTREVVGAVSATQAHVKCQPVGDCVNSPSMATSEGDDNLRDTSGAYDNAAPQTSDMNDSPPSPSFVAVQTANAIKLAATPLKGRTAQRRSRKIIRTGALALEEAKERAPEGGDNYLSCHDSSEISGEKKDVIISGDDFYPAQNLATVKKSAVSFSKKRRKCQKVSKHMVQSPTDEFQCEQFDIISALSSRVATKKSRSHGTYQSKLRLPENSLRPEKGGDTSDISGKKEEAINSGDEIHPYQNSDYIKESAIGSIRKRRKRQKASRHTTQSFTDEYEQFNFSTPCSGATTMQSRRHGTHQSKPRPAEDSLRAEKPDSIIGTTKETTSQCAHKVAGAVTATSVNLQDHAKGLCFEGCVNNPSVATSEGEVDRCNKSEVDDNATPQPPAGNDCSEICTGNRSSSTSATRSISRPRSNLSHPLSTNGQRRPRTYLGGFIQPESESSGLSAVANQESPDDSPEVAVRGRGRCGDASAQDIGTYRMLVDDLSYLCSAIMHCRLKTAQNDERIVPDICKHSPITAGAACDIAELISKSGTRSALLITSAQASNNNDGESKGARVGALEAVLESIACAPPASDLSVICRELIDWRSCLCGANAGISWTQVNGRFEENSPSSGPVPEGPRNSRRIYRTENARLKPATKRAHAAEGSSEESESCDAISSKALAIVSYFIGIDCTGSDRAAILSKSPINRFVVQLARKVVLQHKSALQGIARLVAYDPVVRACLHEASKIYSCGITCLDDGLAGKSSTETVSPQPSESLAPLHDVDPDLSTQFDPTKLGRRSKKRRHPSSQKHCASSHSMDLPKTISERMPSSGTFHGHNENPRSMNQSKPNKKANSFDFFSPSEGGTAPSIIKQTEQGGVGKYEDKISLALSRAKLTNLKAASNILPRCELSLDCTVCSLCAPQMMSYFDPNNAFCGSVSASSLAIAAAECIITGRDNFESQAADTHEVDEDFYDQNPHRIMSTNPIVYANEMLRQSGALPYYSRSMSETLVAILLCSKSVESDASGNTCTKCVTYLQHRASSLSEVIDSLCCLSPNVSSTLSHNKLLLVPSLLRAIAELAFAMENNESPLISESTSTALKTLTSLTHENSDACDQIIRSYDWKIPLPTLSQGSTSSGQITGLDIVFSYLFKTVSSSKQGSMCASHKSNYDDIIFCLNILTNVVEMVPNPTKNMIEDIAVIEGFPCVESSIKAPGLVWLVRWVVSKTSCFRNSVMKGSFGTKDDSKTDIDNNDLKVGEEDDLVTSGNGFVLLACLMIDDGIFPSRSVRECILKELPIDSDGNSGGIQFMVKTLKAFCNFYHYSVGDLSVAVIAPVVKLIAGLEKIDLAEQQATWPRIQESG